MISNWEMFWIFVAAYVLLSYAAHGARRCRCTCRRRGCRR